MIEESDLLRLIAGECSPAEAASIQAWIAADPRRAELLDELRAVWRLTGDATRDWDVAGARDRLLRARGRHAAQRSGGLPARLRAARRPSAASADQAATRPWWMTAWPARIAVAIALTVGAVALWHLRRPAAAPREYATARGRRTTLTLPDGSRVLLSVGTRLLVPRDYGVRERAVELEGEAYFVVQRDPRPFLVQTRHGTTQDLGTEFDVRAYGHEDFLQVVVAEGRVALRGARGPDSTLTLRPRDRGVIDARGGVQITTRVSLDRYIGWTSGTLRFDDAPLGRVIAELERWYDLDIRAGDPSLAGGERLTISFATQSPDEALTALAKVLGVRFTRTDRLVQLVPVHPQQ